jgi:uncharacterized protein (DUF2252 family)
MNCKKATKSYEAWLAEQTSIVEDDLALKHQKMSADVFSFLRATFYRWVELCPNICSELARAPAVLAIGDLHIENFGTWRDSEGRLVWGVNDFDEAFVLPYTNDLLRLAVSAHLAIAGKQLTIRPVDACEAIVAGYTMGLMDTGRPFVLAEKHRRLRSTVMSNLRDPRKFWKKMNGLPAITEKVPGKAKRALEAMFPEKKLDYRVVHRVAGLGSLGRPRFAFIAEWNGGQIAREAKVLLPSAAAWANGQDDERPQYGKIMRKAVRCQDPFQTVHKGWVVRRLSPDCSRVELTALPRGRDEYKLLERMGQETANVHLGSDRVIDKVKDDLKDRPPNWLQIGAKALVQATTRDWNEWRR